MMMIDVCYSVTALFFLYCQCVNHSSVIYILFIPELYFVCLGYRIGVRRVDR